MPMPIISPFGPPESVPITKPVGAGGRNLPEEVEFVRYCLNWVKPLWGGPEDELDLVGKSDKRLIEAIRRFQTYHFGEGNGQIRPNDATLAKLEQYMRGFVDVFVIAQAGSAEDGAILSAHARWEGELEVISVSDLVMKVLARLARDPGKKIMNLTIIGHGSAGHQRVGPQLTYGITTITLANIVNDNALEETRFRVYGEAEHHLTRLRGHFHSEALVTLSGCGVAGVRVFSSGMGNKRGTERKVNGCELLSAVSLLLGHVWVQGSDATQSVSTRGMEGNCFRARGLNCFPCMGPMDAQWWGPTIDDVILDEDNPVAIDHYPTQQTQRKRRRLLPFGRR